MNLKSLQRFIIPAIALVALLWVFNRPMSAFALSIYNLSGKFLYQLTEWISSTQHSAKEILDAKHNATKLQRVNQRLTIANQELKAQLINLEDYRRALEFQNSFGYKLVPAQVIGRSPDSWHQQIIINKGTKDGLKNNQGVITSKGVIGQIRKISTHSAIVQLISNKDWRMGIKLARLAQYGVLLGNFPEAAVLQFITVDSDVQVGDEVLSSGICIDTDNCPYPENFPVAKVIEVEKNPNIVDLVVKVKFNQDLSYIRDVFVLN
jgi:rod shape-determining protein MreC